MYCLQMVAPCLDLCAFDMYVCQLYPGEIQERGMVHSEKPLVNEIINNLFSYTIFIIKVNILYSPIILGILIDHRSGSLHLIVTFSEPSNVFEVLTTSPNFNGWLSAKKAPINLVPNPGNSQFRHQKK